MDEEKSKKAVIDTRMAGLNEKDVFPPASPEDLDNRNKEFSGKFPIGTTVRLKNDVGFYDYETGGGQIAEKGKVGKIINLWGSLDGYRVPRSLSSTPVNTPIEATVEFPDGSAGIIGFDELEPINEDIFKPATKTDLKAREMHISNKRYMVIKNIKDALESNNAYTDVKWMYGDDIANEHKTAIKFNTENPWKVKKNWVVALNGENIELYDFTEPVNLSTHYDSKTVGWMTELGDIRSSEYANSVSEIMDNIMLYSYIAYRWHGSGIKGHPEATDGRTVKEDIFKPATTKDIVQRTKDMYSPMAGWAKRLEMELNKSGLPDAEISEDDLNTSANDHISIDFPDINTSIVIDYPHADKKEKSKFVDITLWIDLGSFDRETDYTIWSGQQEGRKGFPSVKSVASKISHILKRNIKEDIFKPVTGKEFIDRKEEYTKNIKDKKEKQIARTIGRTVTTGDGWSGKVLSYDEHNDGFLILIDDEWGPVEPYDRLVDFSILFPNWDDDEEDQDDPFLDEDIFKPAKPGDIKKREIKWVKSTKKYWEDWHKINDEFTSMYNEFTRNDQDPPEYLIHLSNEMDALERELIPEDSDSVVDVVDRARKLLKLLRVYVTGQE